MDNGIDREMVGGQVGDVVLDDSPRIPPRQQDNAWTSFIESLNNANKPGASSQPERIVFGYGIGKDSLLQTPAQAFVQKLYDYELKLPSAIKSAQKEQLLTERQEFLDGGYKQELREDESVQQMLNEAYQYSLAQQQKCNTEEMSYGKCVIPSFVTKDMADRYGVVSEQISGMLPQEMVQE